jgi:hypothetical protein
VPLAAVAVVAMSFALLVARATPAPALLVGISDQTPESMLDARLSALPIGHARLVVPWDVAFTEPSSVDAWLSAAALRGLTPLVAFERGTGQTCPSACTSPSPSMYADGVRAFLARWPAVRELTPWNEPNHPAQPTAHDPAIAAGYHDQVRILCPTCTVVAGDFVDSANMKSYFRTYAAALRTPAQVWGIHNYGDVTYDRASYLQWLTQQVVTPVWMTETGGIVRLGAGPNQTLPDDPDRAAASIDRVFALARAQPDRVARVYLYQWRARPDDDFDAGLVTPDGTARPALARLRANLGMPAGADLGDTPALGGSADALAVRQPRTAGAPDDADTTAGAHTGASTSTLTVAYGAAPPLSVGRPARVRGGVRVRVTCPAIRRAGCRGSVTVLLQILFARTPLRLGRAVLRLERGQHRELRIAVPRTARRRWNRAPAWRLHTISVIRAPTGVQDRTWSGGAALTPAAQHGDDEGRADR